MKNLWIKVQCLIMGHDWTSEAIKGNPPTKDQVDKKVDGFWDYARMYCDRCGSISELSIRGERRSKARSVS